MRALIDIAAHQSQGCVTLKSVAERQGLSEHYLEQLMAALKKAGFVKSIRGAQGGYHLNCQPSETSVGDILRVLEGSLFPVDCLANDDKTACGNASCHTCAAKPLWEKMYESLNDILDGVTLEQLVQDYAKNNPIEIEE